MELPTTRLLTLDHSALNDQLTIETGVSLADCDLLAVSNLHRLVVVDLTAFDQGPGRRRVVQGEYRWRAHRSREFGAFRRLVAGHWPADGSAAPVPTAWELAGTYRALRRGREEALDAPGAGDFYYGEMEMRRHDATRPFGERVVLWAYWLVSGYGLRPLRSVACLAVVLVTATWLTQTYGLAEPDGRDWWAVFAVVAGSAVSLMGQATSALNTTGEMIRLATRLLTPLLIGLTLLAVRGRVTR